MKVFTGKENIEPEYSIANLGTEENILFFDIETTGLKKETSLTYLIGCGYFKNGVFNIIQWLTERAMDEEEVLQGFAEFAAGFDTLVHFNGDGFDIPFIAWKMDYYGIKFDFGRFRSIDIYKRTKPVKHLLNLESLSQKSIENFLQIERDDLLNGGLLIPVYFDYERTGSYEAERLLLLHNYDDIQGMVKLLPVLSYSDLLEGRFTFTGCEEALGYLILNYETDNAMPVSFEKAAEDHVICGDGRYLQISIQIFEGTACHPIEDYRNYYYLPAEDKIIHKDVAEFIPRDRREKATKKNCFIKKDSRFLFQPSELIEPVFYTDSKHCYFEPTENIFGDIQMMNELGKKYVKCFAQKNKKEK
ncbi:MAG: ribonuclease H-like domain-containing protein [Parasporobacterium sp.]|nr:ribonuclease H-like domain-containing protein [Parasporobacterium sp.]